MYIYLIKFTTILNNVSTKSQIIKIFLFKFDKRLLELVAQKNYSQL